MEVEVKERAVPGAAVTATIVETGVAPTVDWSFNLATSCTGDAECNGHSKTSMEELDWQPLTPRLFGEP